MSEKTPVRKDTLSVGLLQFAPVLGDIGANVERALEGMERLAAKGARLILLPEMFTTGFCEEGLPELAGETEGVLEELRDVAASLGVALCGSMPEPSPESQRVFNTAYLIDEGGNVAASYRKVHLFGPTGEHRHFLSGDSPVIGRALGLNIGLLTCFDLRFPELARSLALSGADLIAVVAQWPMARKEQWRLLLRARALEDQLWVCACNGCGSPGGLRLAGNSLVATPEGEVLTEAGTDDEELVATLDLSLGPDFRRRLPAITTRRPEVYRASNRSKVVSVDELLTELSGARESGLKVAFTNGCFDILHAGHVRYLAAAKNLADLLVVGLNSDSSVRGIKGPERPIVAESQRAEVLSALSSVDYVVVFGEPDPLAVISAIKPDVLVKGADWAENEIVGREVVLANGGRVERIPLVEGASTTGIIEAARKK